MSTINAKTDRLLVVYFDGKKENWKFWLAKFLSRANRKGYRDMFLMAYSEVEVKAPSEVTEGLVPTIKTKAGTKLKPGTKASGKASAKPSAADLAEYKEAMAKYAYEELTLAISHDSKEGKVAFEAVWGCKSMLNGGGDPRAAWVALERIYEQRTAPMKAKLLAELNGMRLKKGENPDLFLTDMEVLRNRLIDLKVIVDVEQFNMLVLNALGREYEMDVKLLELKFLGKEREMTVGDIREAVSLTYDRHHLKHGYKRAGNNGSEEFALIGVGQFKGNCRNCGAYGHKKADCRAPAKGGNNKKRGGGAKKQGHHANAKGGLKKVQFDGKCNYCGKAGHKILQCFKLKAAMKDAESANVAMDGDDAMDDMALIIADGDFVEINDHNEIMIDSDDEDDIVEFMGTFPPAPRAESPTNDSKVDILELMSEDLIEYDVIDEIIADNEEIAMPGMDFDDAPTTRGRGTTVARTGNPIDRFLREEVDRACEGSRMDAWCPLCLTRGAMYSWCTDCTEYNPFKIRTLWGDDTFPPSTEAEIARRREILGRFGSVEDALRVSLSNVLEANDVRFNVALLCYDVRKATIETGAQCMGARELYYMLTQIGINGMFDVSCKLVMINELLEERQLPLLPNHLIARMSKMSAQRLMWMYNWEDTEVRNGLECRELPKKGPRVGSPQYRLEMADHIAMATRGYDLAMVVGDLEARSSSRKLIAPDQHEANTWLGDTGASCHLTNNDEGMTNVRLSNFSVKVGSGKFLRATKVGDLRMKVLQKDGKNAIIILKGVRYVPKLWVNLLSIGKALQNGFDISNKGVIIALEKHGQRIRFDRIMATHSGFVLGVNMVPVPKDEEMANIGFDTKKPMDVNKLHKMLGHVDSYTISRTARHYGWNVTGTLNPCEDCAIGKARQKGLTKTLQPRAKQVGERLFMDTSSVQATSFSHGKYWLLVIDDYSDHCWSYFVKEKGEVGSKLMSLLKWLLGNQQVTVKNIRCDNAGENYGAEKLLLKAGFAPTFEYTAASTPQQNGRVERKFAVLYGKVRSMLNQAHLPRQLRGKLWAEAARNATQIENIIETKSREPACLLLNGKIPTYAQGLRVFGEIGMVFIGSRTIKAKLDDRSKPAMFVGYGQSHASGVYRMMNLATTRVLITRDVTWMNQSYGQFKGIENANRTQWVDLEDDDFDAGAALRNTKVTWERDTDIARKAKAASADKSRESGIDHDDTEDHTREQDELLPGQGDEPSDDEDDDESGRDEERVTWRQVAEGKHLEYSPIRPVARMSRMLRDLAPHNNPPGYESDSESGSGNDEPAEVVETTPATAEERDFHTNLSMFNRDVASMMIDTTQGRMRLDDFITASQRVEREKWDEMSEHAYTAMMLDPTTFEECWDHADPAKRRKWREAINKEFYDMTRRGVWQKIKKNEMPRDRRCVKTKWVFKEKRNGVFRARLVACGYSQIAGVDFSAHHAPVIHDATYRVMLTMKMLLKTDSIIIDFETAFLHGELEEEIYMQCPKGMEHEPDECLLLKKTIYGLVQSARQWNKKLVDILIKLGFQQSKVYPCLLIRNREGNLVLIGTYVDDCLCIGSTRDLKQLVKDIKRERFGIKIENGLEDYLSCRIEFNKSETNCWVNQPHIIKNITDTFKSDVMKLQRYGTPGTPGQGIQRNSEAPKVDKDRHSRYRSGVGMLLYLVKHSRPDIANAVRELTKVLDGPTAAAYKEMLRVMKFVSDTRDYGLRMEPNPLRNNEWKIVVYTDSEFAGDKDNRISVGGHLVLLQGVPIIWRSKAQRSVTLSSTKAEYVALSEAGKEIRFLTQLMEDIGLKMQRPADVMVDNVGAIFIATNPSTSARTRHIDVRNHFIRELIANKEARARFVKSEDNISDGFTKNTKKEIYDRHKGSIIQPRSALD